MKARQLQCGLDPHFSPPTPPPVPEPSLHPPPPPESARGHCPSSQVLFFHSRGAWGSLNDSSFSLWDPATWSRQLEGKVVKVVFWCCIDSSHSSRQVHTLT